jgi:hypothetical protein
MFAHNNHCSFPLKCVILATSSNSETKECFEMVGLFAHIYFPLASVEFQIEAFSFMNEMISKSLTFSIPRC